ncbi:MAG: glycoside hydrolase family 3 C-terminal domain-containing protein, partial [Lachnospiraceae bacterium]|nr:glycoside hydrolase family 3 C-terminal domain-containing protein [Lachnospiraceae bacterium]
MKEIDTLLGELTLHEKAALLEGYKSWKTNAIPRLDIPAICLTDGPVGVRKKSTGVGEGALGLGSPYPSTAFPTPVCIANSWNLKLAEQVGEAMGEECVAYDVDVLLGPALNLKRDPRCGRNFEYYSEDPLLAGKMAAAFTRGLQSTGTAACPKHFALNNSENFRYMGDSVVDERAARELYLKAFELCVKESHPRTMMCSYNKVNGTHASQNKWLLTELLRDEWGFDGLVMSDWGAVVDRVEGIKAGLDLDMPGGLYANRRAIIEAVESGDLSMKELDRAVANVLKLVADAQLNGNAEKKVLEDLLHEHEFLTVKAATDSAVLLKNEGVLPLKEKTKVLAVGDLFDQMCYQGSGSSGLSPAHLTTPHVAFEWIRLNYTFARGYREMTHEPDERLEKEAVASAKDADVILFFGGLTELFESEGYDRENLDMPANQLRLIDRLCDTGKPVVVVLFGGSPMELPFADKVSAILHLFLPGQTGGEACRRILYGEAEPGGRLSETWMKTCADIPFGEQYSKRKIEQYRENIYVGYRFYDRAPEKIRYPFGYGLSYTEFSYQNLIVSRADGVITATLTVTNTGERAGSEVVQLYVGKNGSTKVFKAEKELKAFAKVYLRAGES